MPSNLSFKRKERKYLVLENGLEELCESLGSKVPVSIFSGEEPVSNIQTIYFDTKEHQLFWEYIGKRPIRFKIRLRRYGCRNVYDDHYLVELKVKYNGESSKKRFILPEKYYDAFLRGDDLLSVVKESNVGLVGAQKTYKMITKLMKINKLKPILKTSYERIAFQKKSGRIRFTIDRNITHEKINGVSKVEQIDAVILESKIMGKTPKWLKKLINKLSLLKQTRFSKFATGMNSVYYPSRGKYNFFEDAKLEEDIPENLAKSFELIKSKFKFKD